MRDGKQCRCGAATTVLDAVHLRHAFEEAAFQIRKFAVGLLNLLGREAIQMGCAAAKDLFTDAVGANEFLTDADRIAIQ